VSGIKLDEGLTELDFGKDEKYTLGLDSLSKRAEHFYSLGCRFAKWRCVLKFSNGKRPSELSIRETAYNLARYAFICQRNGLVPIVEPELLTDGDHDIEECAAVSKRIFTAVFDALHEYNVIMEGCLLKPHMVTQGSTCNVKKDVILIAKHTVSVLRDVLPLNLGGVFFLSGGQGEIEATNCLNHINKENNNKGRAWTISFSFGRALQNTVVKTWKGKIENVQKAQSLLTERARMNSQAVKGEYDISQESVDFKDECMFVKDYSY
jgi:fructose-bisphosphate aldolase class I